MLFHMHKTKLPCKISFVKFNKKMFLGKKKKKIVSEDIIKVACTEMGCDGGMDWTGLFYVQDWIL